MEFNALQTETLRQIDDALHHIRAKDRLRQRLQEIIGNNFAAVETGYQKKFQELRDLMGGTPSELIGNTRAMQEVERQVRQIASSDAVVLIRGAAGTGKEHTARTLHRMSERASGPFVILNCDSLNAGEGFNSLESELFGYERGAFTGATARHLGKAEQANGGTLFIDEVGSLPLAAQTKLLQFLQDRRFSRLGSNIFQNANIRIIASTGKDLETLMQQGLFREDLYYRLNIFQIKLPELSQRKTDILLLADHFIAKMNLKYGKKIQRLSTPAIDMLMSYHWPGNVRELENCIEHACLATTDVSINAYDLPPTLQTDVTSGTSLIPEGPASLSTLLRSYEKEILMEALRKNNGNLSAAGRDLQVSPRMMHYKVNKYGIEVKE